MTPLHGLILAGGRNLRIGQDKTRLKIGPHKVEMREFLHRLLSTLLGVCVFSINRKQEQDAYYNDKLYVTDMVENAGPMGGILTAMKSFPQCSFLAVACDMPHVEESLFQRLIAERGGDGVFFEVNSHIEPLCGIYEDTLYDELSKTFQRGAFGLQTFLKQVKIKCIRHCSPELFLNVNTQEDLERFRGGNHGQKNVV